MKQRRLFFGSLFFLFFVVLIIMLHEIDVAAIGPADATVGFSGLNQRVRDLIGSRPFFYRMTQYLGYLAIGIAAAFMLFGGIQLIHRRSIRKVDKMLFLLAGLYVAVAAIYVFFEKVVINYRPVLMDGDSFPEPSFPSTHTMLSCVIFLSTAFVLDRYIRNKALSVAAWIVCLLLAVATVVGRLLSGVHWLTDIIGGIIISTSLLFFFCALLPRKHRHHHHHHHHHSNSH